MIIESDGIRLRLLKRDDFEALWALYTPKIFEHMLNQVENFEDMVAWLEAGMNQSNVLIFAVENPETAEVIGTTRIYAIDDTNKSCEMGATFYALSAQRTHVNTSVKRALLSYCFEERGMIRVQFKTDAENVRSQKAIERIGAVKEGVLRNERIRSNGKPRDAVVYSIIDKEWPKVKKDLAKKANKYT
ncbi:GNAT family N-acetyltransferase [Planococcus donghaensis]|uniref:GNAT family N-acetyltransferase n=1 Tax=Planococcus donghaensis TaxID=414778 RepID=A0A1C7EKW5_9BACL|nr:GNAT family protein [Planococcus donghaensis]ANU24624.1 GNAT family N-acetyltransferase [Planococcus donghaensis]ANU24910.1 GNAT family N-acetyltransferase [Planococcus donghaensis]